MVYGARPPAMELAPPELPLLQRGCGATPMESQPLCLLLHLLQQQQRLAAGPPSPAPAATAVCGSVLEAPTADWRGEVVLTQLPGPHVAPPSCCTSPFQLLLLLLVGAEGDGGGGGGGRAPCAWPVGPQECRLLLPSAATMLRVHCGTPHVSADAGPAPTAEEQEEQAAPAPAWQQTPVVGRSTAMWCSPPLVSFSPLFAVHAAGLSGNRVAQLHLLLLPPRLPAPAGAL